MVILQHDHIIEAHSVVDSSSGTYCLLFEGAHTRGCFAGVSDFCLCVTDFFGIEGGGGGYATHSLHNVKHQSL